MRWRFSPLWWNRAASRPPRKNWASPPPVVSKRVSAVEKELGARLLNRTTRRLSLTEAGRSIIGTAPGWWPKPSRRRQPSASSTANPGACCGSRRRSPSGHTSWPGATGVSRAYPDIQMEVDLSDRKADLAEEGYDLAIRITTRPDDNLAVRRLTSTRRLVCATPGVLGSPRPPESAGRPDPAQLPRLRAQPQLQPVVLSRGPRAWRP